jgi:hypothetical protein
MITHQSSNTDRRVPIGIGAAAFLVVAVGVLGTGVSQNLAAVIAGGPIICLALFWPRIAIALLFIYLPFMGDIRRYLVVQNGVVAQDPMLIIGPVAAIVLALQGIYKQRTMLQTPVSKLIFALMTIMLLEVLNPLQGGITVGLVGILYFIIPLVWFWVGQAWGSLEFLERLFTRIVIPVAVLASLLGMTQTFFGYLPYEAAWFRTAWSAAVKPDIRPFAFFCSWPEYASYVGFGLALVVTPLFFGRFRFTIVLAPLFVAALIIESVREQILNSVLVFPALWAVQAKTRNAVGTRLVLASILALGALVAGMTMLKDVDVSDEANPWLQHSSTGFTDVQQSTAGGHLQMVATGIWQGITNPIGYGLGVTGPAATNSDVGTSEMDFSDIFVTCGIVGGVLYLYIMFKMLQQAVQLWQEQRNPIALYALALLASRLGHWDTGGDYAVTPILWFAVGAMDRAYSLVPAILSEPVANLRSRFPGGARVAIPGTVRRA